MFVCVWNREHVNVLLYYIILYGWIQGENALGLFDVLLPGWMLETLEWVVLDKRITKSLILLISYCADELVECCCNSPTSHSCFYNVYRYWLVQTSKSLSPFMSRPFHTLLYKI